METSMSLRLTFAEKRLNSIAIINIGAAKANTFSFVLNCGFSIHEITCNGRPALWKIDGEHQITTYISMAQKVTITCSDIIDKIVVKYSGSFPLATFEDIKANRLRDASTHNIISNDLIALSYYSVWYPMVRSIDILDHEVIVNGCADYYIVNGVYNDTEKTWHYKGQDLPLYNIIAYKRDILKTVKNPYINIYFLNEQDTKNVEKSACYYKDVLDYYNGGLYPKIKIPKCDMACLMPVLTEGGAYVEDNGLMVTTVLPENDFEIIQLNAHETAHFWCTGAPGTWEDWLNETAAEWSALMYALDQENIDLFEHMLKRWDCLDVYRTFPPIKTKDGSRPDGVHFRGVALFYFIYKKYDKNAIRTILQTFVGLDNKKTGELLKHLRGKVDDSIPSMIERALTIKDYNLL